MTADLCGALTVLSLLLLLSGALAPLETLGWWAGWFGVAARKCVAPQAQTPPVANTNKVPSHYLVFLPGIDSVSEESYASDEVVFLERFRAKLPDTELVELFPYSVTNRALTGQRLFGRVWRWIVARRIAGRSVIGFLINVRNPWQVVVSADKRYGPISRYHLVCTTPGQRSAV